ncbi:hypothetical protein BDZ97DRAFT_1836859 [Flammula alnicola]|nr:hypothetical protein BDZ97DRAFT_1836859 [Flammula alnicola]
MYSRLFSLFVAVACTTLSAAAPVPATAPLDAVSGVVSSLPEVTIPLPSLPPAVSTEILGAVNKVESAIPSPAKDAISEAESVVSGLVGTVGGAAGNPSDLLKNLPRANAPTLPQIIQDMSAKITPVVQNLKAAVANKTNVDSQVVTGNLQNIVDILSSSRDEIQSILGNPVSFAESLLSVGGILTAVGPLLQLLFSVLALVMSAVAATPLGPVVTPLVATIGSLVGEVLALATQILPGLLTSLVPTITSLLPILSSLNLTSVLSILNLASLPL